MVKCPVCTHDPGAAVCAFVSISTNCRPITPDDGVRAMISDLSGGWGSRRILSVRSFAHTAPAWQEIHAGMSGKDRDLTGEILPPVPA